MDSPSPPDEEISPDDRNHDLILDYAAFRRVSLASLAHRFGRELADTEHEYLDLHRTIFLTSNTLELVRNILFLGSFP